jgi:hypothetical protein
MNVGITHRPTVVDPQLKLRSLSPRTGDCSYQNSASKRLMAMEFEFNDIDDAEFAQLELTPEEVERCEMWAERRRLIEEIRNLQDSIIVAQAKTSNSLEDFWKGSASASVERDYRLGRTKIVRI